MMASIANSQRTISCNPLAPIQKYLLLVHRPEAAVHRAPSPVLGVVRPLFPVYPGLDMIRVQPAELKVPTE
jgi:hypothetical protein